MPASARLTLYGTYWCLDCRRTKQFLGEAQIPYRWVDIEQDPAGEAYVLQRNGGKRIIPTVEFPDGSVLLEPSNWGFILTGHDLIHAGEHLPGYEAREPAFLETSVPGIFAAGDARQGSTKQVASAAGEGASSALLVREYLKTV